MKQKTDRFMWLKSIKENNSEILSSSFPINNLFRLLTTVSIYSILFLWIWYFSSKALWLGDDITYLFHFKTGNVVSSFNDIFTSQIEHYRLQNGRFLAHYLVQMFIALLGKSIFAVVNAVLYIVVVRLILLISDIPTEKTVITIMTILLILFGLQTKFVPTCQIGYIWMFSFVFIFLYCFFKYANVSCKLNIYSIGLLPLGFLAGFSQEAIVIGIAGALAIYVYQNNKIITVNQWLLLIGYGLGIVLLVFSPGTLNRMGETHGSVDFMPPFVYSLIKLFYYLRASYILFIFLLFLLFRGVPFAEIYKSNRFYFDAYIILFLFNIFIGVFGNRQLFGFEVLACILLIRIFNKYASYSQIIVVVTCLFLIMLVKTFDNKRFLDRNSELYSLFYNEYLESKDGTIYYDLSKEDVTYYETYPSDVYTPYVISTLKRQFQLSDIEEHKSFNILPVCCKNLNVKGKGNQIIDNIEDTYIVRLEKSKDPMDILLKRNIEIFFLSLPFKEMKVSDSSIVFENEYYKVYHFFDKFPIVKSKEIVIF